MTKYIKDKNGKFAGSIGEGKTSNPTTTPRPPLLQERLTPHLPTPEGYQAYVAKLRTSPRSASSLATALKNRANKIANAEEPTPTLGFKPLRTAIAQNSSRAIAVRLAAIRIAAMRASVL